jgi:hypothetical protein
MGNYINLGQFTDRQGNALWLLNQPGKIF